MEYASLRELLDNDPESKLLFAEFSPDAQVALQEQRQSIHTREDLRRVAASFDMRSQEW